MTEISQPRQPEPVAGEVQDHPAMGPELQEQAEAEQQHEVSRGDIEALARETTELHAVRSTIGGLEAAVIFDGWQAIAGDGRYGAEAILRACGVGPGEAPHVTSMSGFFERLEPDVHQRELLFDAIARIDGPQLYQRINGVAGGAGVNFANGENSDSYRQGNVGLFRDGKAGMHEDAVLFSSDLTETLARYPDLQERLVASSDLVAFIRDLRDVYNGDVRQLHDAVTGVRQQVEALIAQGQQEVDERHRPQLEQLQDAIGKFALLLESDAAQNTFVRTALQSDRERAAAALHQEQEQAAADRSSVPEAVFGHLGMDRGFATYGVGEQHLPREDRPTKIHIPHDEEAVA